MEEECSLLDCKAVKEDRDLRSTQYLLDAWWSLLQGGQPRLLSGLVTRLRVILSLNVLLILVAKIFD